MLHVTPLFHISARQKEFIEPSFQEAEFVMHLDRDHIVNCAVGFLQILTNTATKLRKCQMDHFRRVFGSPT